MEDARRPPAVGLARVHRVWERHDVQGVESRTKRAMHPTAGLMLLEYTNLWLGQGVGTRIIAFTPADERTRKRLERLHESSGAARLAAAAR